MKKCVRTFKKHCTTLLVTPQVSQRMVDSFIHGHHPGREEAMDAKQLPLLQGEGEPLGAARLTQLLDSGKSAWRLAVSVVQTRTVSTQQRCCCCQSSFQARPSLFQQHVHRNRVALQKLSNWSNYCIFGGKMHSLFRCNSVSQHCDSEVTSCNIYISTSFRSN